MKVEVNQMVFDSTDPLCRCIVSRTQGKLYAFVQCIDTGSDGQQRYTKRYWGEYSYENPESMMSRILLNGGSWPEISE